jgi:Uri superfamily endonuclease
MKPKSWPEITSRSGTYVLVFRSAVHRRLKIGRLGTLVLEPGTCLYVGSAFGPGGLRARTARHRTKNTVKRWHIDYLKPWVRLVEIWFTEDSVHREHEWANWFGSNQGLHTPLPGFGSSDCRCPSHLFHAAKAPDFDGFCTMQSTIGGKAVDRLRLNIMGPPGEGSTPVVADAPSANPQAVLAVELPQAIFKPAMIPQDGTRKHTTLIEASTRRIPLTVYRLNAWQYLERSLQRMLCGWARHQTEWEDVSALHRHIWDQSEIVNRLRQRIEQFPGGRADAPVNPALETVAETILAAPAFEDAMDGIFGLLAPALSGAYRSYVIKVHPVHDAPTLSVLTAIIAIRDAHETWYRAYRARRPHRTEPAYAKRVIRSLDQLNRPEPYEPPGRGDRGARPVGVASGFRLAAKPGRPSDSDARIELFPYIRCDFASNIEARRLFWAIGYMREKNLAIDMVRWLFDGHHMPWEWHQRRLPPPLGRIATR